MQLTSPFKAIRRHFKRVKTESKSANYQKWRQRFLLERLHLAVGIAAIVYPIFLTLFLLLVLALKAAGAADPSLNNIEELLLLAIKCSATELSLILCLTLLKIKSVCRYPELILLCFSWSFTLLWQIHDTLRGEPHQLNLIYWFLFPFQALLVPVHWRLHLVSQLSPLVYHFGVNPLLGLDLKMEQPIYFITNVLFIFIICFIFNLAVYLYERILWSEFELRQQLRVFLHAVSHDLRNPVLGTVMVLKNLLNQAGEKITLNRSILERMVESSDRQLELINSLIDTHAAEVRGVVLHCKPLQLGSLIESVIADFEPMLDKNQATIKLWLEAELPLLVADPLQLRRVYENLIANALKYNSPGLNITLSAKREGDRVLCTVADDGVGMRKEQCEKLFDLYFRGFQQRQSIGLGLGLYLCRQIITAHGGEIGVNSRLGEGATFWFTLAVTAK